MELSAEDLAEIEGAVDFDPGFPLNFISPMAKSGAKGPKDILFTDMSGKFDCVEGHFVSRIFSYLSWVFMLTQRQPIRPHQAS